VHGDDRAVLFPSDEVLVQSADISVVVEGLEVKDEEEDGGERDVSPQLQLQLAPSTPPLYLASKSKHERRQVEISSCNDSDVARRPSNHTKSCCEERRASTTAFTVNKAIASIRLDQFFEAEGFIFNK
jgi:hypothetical protein